MDSIQAEREELRQEPLTALIAKLSKDVSLLVRQEVTLAKQEAADKLATVKAEAVGVALGVVLGHVALLVLIAALVLGLSELVKPWLAGLIVGVVLAGTSAALLLRSKERLSHLDLKPERALQNVRRDVEAVKEAAQ
jgi:hypothetical protein